MYGFPIDRDTGANDYIISIITDRLTQSKILYHPDAILKNKLAVEKYI